MNPSETAPIIGTNPAGAAMRSGFTGSASRRGLLRAGSIALWGGPATAGLDRFLAAREFAEGSAPARPRRGTFGKAKRCILLFMWGGPAQQDTWDMKPEAPAEFRGEFRPIPTSVPGLTICEHFPRLARQAHPQDR